MLIPDDHVVHGIERYGTDYPSRGERPICPVCGSECETVYKDVYHEILGCDECLTAYDAWDDDECMRRWDS